MHIFTPLKALIFTLLPTPTEYNAKIENVEFVFVIKKQQQQQQQKEKKHQNNNNNKNTKPL